MPTYEYRCEKCKKDFEVTMSLAEHEKGEVACPKCKSANVIRLISRFTAQTSRKS